MSPKMHKKEHGFLLVDSGYLKKSCMRFKQATLCMTMTRTASQAQHWAPLPLSSNEC